MNYHRPYIDAFIRSRIIGEKITVPIINSLKHMKKIFGILFLLVACMNAFAFPASPWENGQSELGSGQDGILPNIITNWFDREREQWDYDPRFMPAAVTFHPAGYTFMRMCVPEFYNAGDNALGYRGHFWSQEAYMQFKTATGTWKEIPDFITAIRNYFSLGVSDELYIESGILIADTVECSEDGKVMTLCNTMYVKNGQTYYANLILYSDGDLTNWQVQPLSADYLRISPYRVHTDKDRLPVLTSSLNGITLYIPEVINGVLDVSNQVNLVPSSADPHLHTVMAGSGARCVTSDNKTFVVYCSMTEEPGYTGTPQYIVEYDHDTQTITGPVFLGTTGTILDIHNTPVIDIDSNGYLHVIGGAHFSSFAHWVSSSPRTITGNWTRTNVAGSNDNTWSRNGLTYPGFAIDKNDNLHLVCRGRDSYLAATDPASLDTPFGNYPYGGWLTYALVYLRKKPGQSWETRKDVATPQWNAYSNWYHKISINRDGSKVFVTYYYYANELNFDINAKNAYETKWGFELPGGVYTDNASAAHDPVLAVTTDQGDTWRIATTPDLDDSVFRLDLDDGFGSNIATDSSGNGNDGTLTNMNKYFDWVTGKIGNALDFDGYNDYLDCGQASSVDLTGDLTIALWVKPDDIASHRQNPIDKSYANEFSLTIEPNGRLSFYTHRSLSPYLWTYVALEPGTVQNGVWQHIVITRDTATRTMKTYYNGVLTQTATYPVDAVPTVSTNPLLIGSGYAGAFDGKIDDVRIYERPLTQSEVIEYYQQY